jgi:hypothetical protein
VGVPSKLEREGEREGERGGEKERERERENEARHRAERGATSLRAGGGVLAAAAIVAIGVWLVATSDDAAPRATTTIAPTQKLPAEAAPAQPRPSHSPAPAELSIASGQTLALAFSELPSEGVLVLDLELGEPSRSDEPLTGRIISSKSEVLPLTGRLGEGLTRAQVEVPVRWLASDRYVIEIRTTETSHMPLRRYAIEVR